AGGNLGPSILKALRDAGTFNISILSRADSKSTFPSDNESLQDRLQRRISVVSLQRSRCDYRCNKRRQRSRGAEEDD
ncbi:hypothetical protein LTR60_007416, partial [Cryomyces antarcticus]